MAVLKGLPSGGFGGNPMYQMPPLGFEVAPAPVSVAGAQDAVAPQAGGKRKYVSLTRDIARQKKLAEALSQMGAEEGSASTVGGITAPMSALGPLVRGLTSFGGSYLSGKAEGDMDAATDEEQAAVDARIAEIFYEPTKVEKPKVEKAVYEFKPDNGGVSRLTASGFDSPTDVEVAPLIDLPTLSARERVAGLTQLAGTSDIGKEAAGLFMPIVLSDLARERELFDKNAANVAAGEQTAYDRGRDKVTDEADAAKVIYTAEQDEIKNKNAADRLKIARDQLEKDNTDTSDLQLGAGDPLATGITGQTGLPLQAFQVLIGNAASLPRDAATRGKAFEIANNFLKGSGVDAAAFSSRYKAYSETLQKNIARVNQVEIMQEEILGTIENLTPIAEALRVGNLTIANAIAIAAGKELDSPQANEYGFQLQQLRSELSAYNAALQGRSGNNIFVRDQEEADRLIKNGLSTGGIAGIKKALKASTEKMQPILNSNVDKAQRRIWEMFGVGDKYKNKSDVPDPSSDQVKLDKLYEARRLEAEAAARAANK